MSSHESRQESCTDHNDESERTCDFCGETYSHATTAGPGRSKRSCGCDVVLNPVADNTPIGVANTAIRALNATGDVETAADVHEGARGRLVADGGVDLQDIGTVVSSTRFEGDRFAFETSDAAVTFDFTSPELARATAETLLPDGYKVVQEDPRTDGGIPDTLEELAGTCESCGDDVDPDRLIEGECPGCHYRPAADGGTAWTDLTGFKRDMLEAIRRLDNDGETTYGLAIKEELERVYGKDVHHGRLYPNLDDLVDAALVEKSELDKRTNEYELTTEAEAMLEQRARHLADACGMEQPVADGGDQA